MWNLFSTQYSSQGGAAGAALKIDRLRNFGG
jgi:hypothetical protein